MQETLSDKDLKKYLLQITGGSNNHQTVIQSLHHGLEEFYEMPFVDLGPLRSVLDFNEFAAFLVQEYNIRNEYGNGFNSSRSFKDVFKYSLENGQSKLSEINPESKLFALSKKINPYEGDYLDERLDSLDSTNTDDLMSVLTSKPIKFYFMGPYEKMLKAGLRSPDNKGMTYMPTVWPRKGPMHTRKRINAFADRVVYLLGQMDYVQKDASEFNPTPGLFD